MSEKHVVTPFHGQEHIHAECLEAAISAAEKTCALRGVRLTSLRKRVLELVWSSHEPVKAYDILDRMRDEKFSSAPPTVYRALEFLQEEGMVHKIESLNAYMGCARPDYQHISQFLICEKCGAVAELDDPEIREILASKAAAMGFDIKHEMIEIQGMCYACRHTHDR